MAFASILGHEPIKEVLGRAIAENRCPPALLLSGPRGVGKRTLAQAAARALLCEKHDGDSCGQCGPCRRALRGLHPDMIFLEPATAVIKIEQVRDVVREIAGRPFEAGARGIVIDEAHSMTEEASNSLLKSLEEPPPTSHVFLVTPAPQSLLPTIRSRCQELRLGPLPLDLIERTLAEAGLPASEARLRARLSGGSLGGARNFESEAYRAQRETVLALLERLPKVGALELLEWAESVADSEEPETTLNILRSLLRDSAALRVGARTERLLNFDIGERLAPVAKSRVGERAVVLGELVAETRSALDGNANALLAMDVLADFLAG